MFDTYKDHFYFTIFRSLKQFVLKHFATLYYMYIVVMYPLYIMMKHTPYGRRLLVCHVVAFINIVFKHFSTIDLQISNIYASWCTLCLRIWFSFRCHYNNIGFSIRYIQSFFYPLLYIVRHNTNNSVQIRASEDISPTFIVRF